MNETGSGGGGGTYDARYELERIKQAAAQEACCKTAAPARPANVGLQGVTSQELSLDNIDDAMRYQPWNETQREQGEVVREALVFAAKAVLRFVPRSPRRTLALQHLISARMDANAAISFNGRF